MIIETFVSNKLYEKYQEESKNGYNNDFLTFCHQLYMNYRNNPVLIIAIIISTISSIAAGMLAWNCNIREHGFIRIVNTLIAVMFNEIYILYYVIYRVLLKNKCY